LSSEISWAVRDAVDAANPQVVQPGILDLGGRHILENYAAVELSGSQTSFEGIQSLAFNYGSILVSHGNQLSITPDNPGVPQAPLQLWGSTIAGDIPFDGRLETAAGGQLTVNGSNGIHNNGGEIHVGTDSYLSAAKIVLRDSAPVPGMLHVDGVAATDLVSISPNGTLSGSGVIRGRVVGDVLQNTRIENHGTVSPGNSRGALTVMGDYIQSPGATLAIDGVGLDDGIQIDQLLVSGSAVLDGNLQLRMSGIAPSHGDSFAALTAGALTGEFDNVANGGRLALISGGGSFQVDYDGVTSAVVLSNFLTDLPGDYNNDGQVDGGDFLVWQNNLGAPAGALLNDPHDEVISGAQLATWKANFGLRIPNNSPTAQAAVPEPDAVFLFCFGAILCGRPSQCRIRLGRK
jgi:hypothetical protein